MGSSLGTADTVRSADDRSAFSDRLETHTVHYDVRGIGLAVSTNVPAALDLIDATYAAFRVARAAQAADTVTFRLIDLGAGGPCRVDGPAGRSAVLPTLGDGILAILEGMVGAVVAGLHRQGLYAIHAGAVAGPNGTAIVAGRSGQGKSTLILGLVRHGFELLSDELAVLDPGDGRVHPYPRAIHVRPGTLELIPELAPLAARPLVTLGGGREWSVAPTEAVELLGGRLGEPTRLAALILLDGQPDPAAAPRIRAEVPAVAALELLRSTWAASADFAGTLEAVGGMLAAVPCYRLAIGGFDATVAAMADLLGPVEDGQ